MDQDLKEFLDDLVTQSIVVIGGITHAERLMKIGRSPEDYLTAANSIVEFNRDLAEIRNMFESTIGYHQE